MVFVLSKIFQGHFPLRHNDLQVRVLFVYTIYNNNYFMRQRAYVEIELAGSLESAKEALSSLAF